MPDSLRLRCSGGLVLFIGDAGAASENRWLRNLHRRAFIGRLHLRRTYCRVRRTGVVVLQSAAPRDFREKRVRSVTKVSYPPDDHGRRGKRALMRSGRVRLRPTPVVIFRAPTKCFRTKIETELLFELSGATAIIHQM